MSYAVRVGEARHVVLLPAHAPDGLAVFVV